MPAICVRLSRRFPNSWMYWCLLLYEGYAQRAARSERLLFFFFQAEDGIRDTSVTGVQTCALPISTRAWITRCVTATRSRSCRLFLGDDDQDGQDDQDDQHRDHRAHREIDLIERRSEERRVGKECRTRGST